jgi:hypothetical protein
VDVPQRSYEQRYLKKAQKHDGNFLGIDQVFPAFFVLIAIPPYRKFIFD